MNERSNSQPASGRPRVLWAAPIHPVLFFLFPVVSLLAWNIQELYADQAVRSLLVALAACLLLWAVLAALTRDVHLAAALTSWAGVLFFSYGHVYDLLAELPGLALQLARHRYLIPAWAAVFLAVSAVLIRKRASLRSAAPVLNAVGLAALLLPLLSLATLALRARTDDGRATRIPELVLRPPSDEPAPDIYYIILDGYARSDFMAEAIGLDNSAFIAFLEDQGFYVAGAARSNHNWTSLSLASSLNMTLAQHLGANMLPGYYPTPFINFIRNSFVSRSLQGIGYHTVGLQSGYLPTEWVEADAYLGPATDALPARPEGFQPNAFETMLLDSTILGPVVSRISLELEDAPTRNESYPHEVLRAIILSAFDRLARPLPLEGPRLVFAHIVAPHRPYLFSATGAAIDPGEPFTLMEDAEAGADTRGQYRDQAAYVTARTQAAVQAILSQQGPPPVIILQADHGAGLGLGEEERTSILYAILIRDTCRSMLYPSITPVNTFRVVFNCYFDARLPLVADETYWSKWPRESAYEFLRIFPEPTQP